ncbi:MAG: ribosome rescue protein RqcH [Candidatus Bathyarchaeia archaeon]
MLKTLTSFDVATIVLELRERLKGARIQNIYQTNRNILILKLHQPNQPPLNLLIEPGKRFHLTVYLLEKPQKPPAFCMALRKYLRNSSLIEIKQHEFERITSIKARTKEEEVELVLELFGEGNIILVDAHNVIRQALVLKRMRDRNILRGVPFQQAPSSGENPLHLKLRDLSELKKFKNLEIVRALTKFLSIGGIYAEEILLRAQVDKNKACISLEDSDFNRIFTALSEILFPLKSKKFEPRIIIDKKGSWIDAVPITLRKYKDFKFKKFKSFNEALDEYYAKTFVQQDVTAVTEKVEEEIARQQRMLEEQRESLQKAKQKAEHTRKVGDKIYTHFHQLQMLLHRIMEAKKSKKTWQEIVSEIQEEKKAGKAPSVFFDSLDAKRLAVNVSIEGLTFSLKIHSSIQDNAAAYYEKAKKAEKKIVGAEKAITGTLRRIEDLKQQKKIVVEKTEKPVKKRRKKAWYEKFWWFHTSEGFLVVGGKDAVTNEVLIKKYMEQHDLVFHADITGAPFVLIKTEGKKPSQQSICEAAQLAASHSRAWKAKFSAIDVYWVHPEQVSKTPPPGEYLSKGAFMIHGKKNYVKKTPVRLAIGIDVKVTPPNVLGGPKDAVESRTDIYVEIVPGDLPSSQLARKIREILKQKVPENLRETISKLSLEAIQVFIPFGTGTTFNH